LRARFPPLRVSSAEFIREMRDEERF